MNYLFAIIACFGISQCSGQMNCYNSGRNYGYPSYESRYGFPLNKNTNYSFHTYAPVPLNSKYVDTISLSPLQIIVNASAPLATLNIGNQVYTITTNKTVGNVLTFKGGPFYNETYIFALLSYTNDGFCGDGTRAGTLEDGKGYPVQFRIVGYNSKYPQIYPFATSQRDGVVVLYLNVKVSSKKNRYFPYYEKVLKDVREPNGTSSCTAVEAMAWLLEAIKDSSGYYVYPGSYVTQEFGQQECATMIHPSFDVHPEISYEQFKSFLKVKSQAKRLTQEMTNTLGVHELNGRPVCRVSRSSYFDIRWYK